MASIVAFLWQEFTTHFITKATPISYFDSKYHIKKLKSSRTCLIGYSGFISFEWFLITWGGDTHTRTYAYRLSGKKQFQETKHTPVKGS